MVNWSLIIFTIVFVIGFLGLGYMHEQVHVQIFERYGIESHVDYISYFPALVTVPDGDIRKCTDNCKLAHDINEAVGYQLIPFYFMIGVGILIMIGEIIVLNVRKQNRNSCSNDCKEVK